MLAIPLPEENKVTLTD